MDKLQLLQGMLRSDKVLVGEIRSKVGVCEPVGVIELQGKLQYSVAEGIIRDLKSSGVLSDKLFRLERDFAKIAGVDFEVCKWLNGMRARAPVKKVKQVVVKQKVVRPDFSCLGTMFGHIGSERLPVVLSASKVVDLASMPHLLVAGSTGSGKSVFLNVAVLSLMYKLSPEFCKLVLIDPKRVEFSFYKHVPYLYGPVASTLEDIDSVLSKLVDEMEWRYIEFERLCVKSIEAYNACGLKMPYIVLVIDELADLMMISDKSITVKIIRLAQLARAAGIHIIMATQRPVVEIITGLIKANMPARIAFRVESKQDSRIILDAPGADQLNGNGDMLFKFKGIIERQQGLFITEQQIKQICKL